MQFNAEEEIELFCWHCSASELVFNFSFEPLNNSILHLYLFLINHVRPFSAHQGLSLTCDTQKNACSDAVSWVSSPIPLSPTLLWSRLAGGPFCYMKSIEVWFILFPEMWLDKLKYF